MPQIYLDIDATGSVRGIKQYEDATERGAKATEKLTGSAKKGFERIAKAAVKASAAVGVAVTAIATVSVKTFADFDDQVRMAAATAGATATEFLALADAAKEAGASTRFAASESAEALTLLAQRGFDVTQAIAAMPEVLNLAAANQIALADATSVATGVLRGFGKEVEDLNDINDVLTATSQKSGANVLYLGDAFKYAAPAAKGSKEELESASAVIGALADNAFQGGEAGNAYKRMLIALQAPTASQAAAQERLNLTITDSLGNFVGLIPILEQLKAKNIDLVDAYELFGAYTATAGLAAADSADRIRKLYGELKTLDDVTAKTAEFQEEGLGGALRSLKSATEAVAIAIGEQLAPVIKDAADYLTEFARNTASVTSASTTLLSIVTPLVNGFGGLYLAAQGVNIVIGETVEQVYKVVDSFNDLLGFTQIFATFGLDINADEAIKEIESFNDVQQSTFSDTFSKIEAINKKIEEYKNNIKDTKSESGDLKLEGLKDAAEQLDTVSINADSAQQSLSNINNTPVSVGIDINYENKPIGAVTEEIKSKIDEINQDYIVRINTDPAGAIELASELDELESQLARQTEIDSYNQKIKNLRDTLKTTKEEFFDERGLYLTIDTDPAASAAIEAQIAGLQQQKFEIDGLIPGLERVNGVWEQIPATISAGAAQATGSLTQFVDDAGLLETTWKEIDGVWKEVLPDGTELIQTMTGELQAGAQAAVQYGSAVAQIGENNEGISDAQKILDDIYKGMKDIPDVSGKFDKLVDSKAALEILQREISGLKKLMKDLDPASEEAARAIRALMKAEAAESTLKDEIKDLEKEIEGTGEAAEKTSKKIKEIPKIAESAAKSVRKVAESNRDVAESLKEVEKTQGDIARAAFSSAKTFEISSDNTVAGIEREIEKLKEEEEIIKRINEAIFGKPDSFTSIDLQARDKTLGQEQIQELEAKKFSLEMEKVIDRFVGSVDKNVNALNQNTEQIEEGVTGSARVEQMGTTTNNFNMTFEGMSRDDVKDIGSDLKRMAIRE